MWPGLGLSGVGEKVHDDGTLADGGVNVEEVLALNPAILLGLLPGSTALADTDNDIEAVVAEVETLTVTLGAVADEGEGVVLEVLEETVAWPVSALYRELWSALSAPEFLGDNPSNSSSIGVLGSCTYRKPPPCGRRSQQSSHHGSAGQRRWPLGQSAWRQSGGQR